MGRAKPKSKSSSTKRGRSVSKASSSRERSSSKGKEKTRTTRKVKDKKRPKRALGAYMYFCKDQRREIQEQNPDMSFGDIGRVLGKEWSSLSDKDKEKYVRKAETDKRRYDKEMKRYKPR